MARDSTAPGESDLWLSIYWHLLSPADGWNCDGNTILSFQLLVTDLFALFLFHKVQQYYYYHWNTITLLLHGITRDVLLAEGNTSNFYPLIQEI